MSPDKRPGGRGAPPEAKGGTQDLAARPPPWNDLADLWTPPDGALGDTRPGGLFSLPQNPRISDVEAAVCFADVRGFTAYCNELQKQHQDSKIQNFLKVFLGVFPRSLLRMLWQLEPSADGNDPRSAHAALLRRHVVPSSYKNLGDGCMLVWEFPSDLTNTTQALLTQAIFQLVVLFYEDFSTHFHRLNRLDADVYSAGVTRLKLGLGLAKGHVWKLDLGPGLKPDYAGSIVNLAAHLQGAARPEGILCQRLFSRGLFDQLIASGVGAADRVTLKGEDEQEVVRFAGDKARELRVWPGSASKAAQTGPGRGEV